MTAEDSMFYWYPKIKDLGVPMPRTILLPYEKMRETTKAVLYENEDPPHHWNAYLEEVKAAAETIGYPVFIRADETSNKHDWVSSCYVEKPQDLEGHMFNIVEFVEMQFLSDLVVRGFVIREFMELDVKFTAFNGFPVAREFRFFVKEGRLQCWHPYWFPSAIVSPSTEDYISILAEMEKLSEADLELLTGYAEKIAGVLNEYWSIDFCQLADGTWAMTDMATGNNSYHFTLCQHTPKEQKESYPPPYEDTWKARHEELKAFQKKYE